MMEAMLSFADKHLKPYTLRGDELIPDYCPICHGGDNRDRYTFALNLTEGIYVCKRGSCGARGRFEELARHFGEQAEIIRPPGRARKQYVLPEVELKPLTEEIIGYFGKRKISRETLDAFKIGSDDRGNIVFPFYRDNALVYVKYRAPRKPQGKEKKEWQAHNTQPILFGMDLCAFSQPLIITEGQIDCLSLYEAGIRNVVSVPSGCSNLDWIDTCWEWLEKFQTISAKRQLRNAKEHKLHFDLSFGRATKALILLEDGRLVSCALTPRTIAGRIDAIPTEGDEDDEDHQADGEDIDAD